MTTTRSHTDAAVQAVLATLSPERLRWLATEADCYTTTLTFPTVPCGALIRAARQAIGAPTEATNG